MAPKPTPQNRLCVGPNTVLISYELPPLEIQARTPDAGSQRSVPGPGTEAP